MSSYIVNVAETLINKMQKLEEQYILSRDISNLNKDMKSIFDTDYDRSKVSYDDLMYLHNHKNKYIRLFVDWYPDMMCRKNSYDALKYKELINENFVLAMCLYLIEKLDRITSLDLHVFGKCFSITYYLYSNYMILDDNLTMNMLNYYKHSYTSYGYENGYTFENIYNEYKLYSQLITNNVDKYKQLSETLNDMKIYAPGGSGYELTKNNFQKKITGLKEENQTKYEFKYDVFNDLQWNMFKPECQLVCALDNYFNMFNCYRTSISHVILIDDYYDEIRKLSLYGTEDHKYNFTSDNTVKLKLHFYKKLLHMRVELKILQNRIEKIQKEIDELSKK